MTPKMRLIIFLILISFNGSIECQRHYWISAPAAIRPNSPYDIAVTFEGPNQTDSCKLKIFIKNSTATLIQETVEVHPQSTKRVLLEVGQIVEDVYTLNAKSVSGCQIDETTTIKFNDRRFAILVQTDKSIYKPGDLVRYRVLTIDEATLPVVVEKALSVNIVDEKNRIIYRLDKVSTPKGVYSDTFQLANSTVLGKWKILVQHAEHASGNRTFQVAEYKLPLVEVTLQAPQFVLYGDTLPITVIAKYTFGTDVKGQHKVHIQDLNEPAAYELSTTFVTHGRRTVEFNLNDLEFAERRDGRILKVTSSLIDEATDETYESAVAYVKLFRQEYHLEVITAKSNFYPELPLGVSVFVKTHGGKPVYDTKNVVSVLIKHDHDSNVVYYDEFQMDNRGKFQFQHLVPEGVSIIFVEAKYKQTTTVLNVTKPVNDGHHHILVVPKNKRNLIDRSIPMQVTATEPISLLHYHVISRGQIVQSDTVTFATGTMKPNFKFMATFSMFPEATVLVFYASASGDIVSDSTQVKFGEAMKNYVDLILSKPTVEPRDNVSLTIYSTVDSYVGLLGVDKSVKILRNENDITQKKVTAELEELRNKNTADLSRSLTNSYREMLAAGLIVLTSCRKKERGSRVLKFPDIIEVVESADDKLWIRENFPETWIWQDLTVTSDLGMAVEIPTVPDAITAWQLTAFSLHPVYGLGLTNQITELTVFQPFFVTTNLPYSVRLGEVVEIPVQVFNYLALELSVTIEIVSDDLTFVDGQSTKIVTVLHDSPLMVTFKVTPKKIGILKFEIGATSTFAGERIVQYLKVKPEGVVERNFETVVMNLNDKKAGVTSLNISVPASAVPDSTKIEISISGDIMAAMLEQLNDLVKGSAEGTKSNLQNFVPNIVLLDYLTATNQATPAIEKKVKNQLRLGYQSQLTFQHDDASFSVYGRDDSEGSIWMTIYALKAMSAARRYIAIDERVMSTALSWLLVQQKTDGRFEEPGFHYFSPMQTDSAALTAFAVLTLFRYPAKDQKTVASLERANQFIMKNLESQTTYALSLIVYALSVQKNPMAGTALAFLEEKSTTTPRGLKYWSRKKGKRDSQSIEMTAYAILAHVEMDREWQAEPMFKWILKQRRQNGKFATHHDTVIGVQALAKLTEKLFTQSSVLNIGLTYGGNERKVFTISQANILTPVVYTLPPSTGSVELAAEGSGLAIFNVATEYSTYDVSAADAFDLVVTVVKKVPSDHLVLKVCGTYKHAETTTTNLAELEVTFPSGYTFDWASKAGLERAAQKVEINERGTVVKLLYTSFDRNVTCFDVEAKQTTKVTGHKPAYAAIGDGTEPDRRTLAFYSLV